MGAPELIPGGKTLRGRQSPRGAPPRAAQHAKHVLAGIVKLALACSTRGTESEVRRLPGLLSLHLHLIPAATTTEIIYSYYHTNATHLAIHMNTPTAEKPLPLSQVQHKNDRKARQSRSPSPLTTLTNTCPQDTREVPSRLCSPNASKTTLSSSIAVYRPNTASNRASRMPLEPGAGRNTWCAPECTVSMVS